MSGVYPIPTGRTSDALLSRRLLSQLQSEQRRMLEVQQQLGTGRRFQLPSEDASSANRALSLQRILETKQQLKTNVSATQSYLNATDTALSSVADLLSNARGLAVSAADSTTSDLERRAIAIEIQSTVQQLLNVGNQQFRGRYLFSGSESTVQPFDLQNGYVNYAGNDKSLRTYTDVNSLFDTNVPGEDLFGAVSSEVQGIDLNVVLREDTRLSELRAGQGITKGTILVSDGTHTSAVSLAGAETIGDVARLIEANPPAGRELSVSIEARGLKIEMDAAGGGSFTIRDEPGGLTAAQLGILRLSGRAIDPIVGQDLNPALQLTSRLEDILGVRAKTYLRSSGADNDIVLEARTRGTAMNDYAVQFVDHNLLQAAPGISAGSEFAEFDANARAAQAGIRLSGINNDLVLRANVAGVDWNNVTIELQADTDMGDAANVSYSAATRTLTLSVDDSDETTLGTLVTAINASGLFTAQPDPSRGEGYDPASSVMALDAGVVGSTGNSGGAANTVYVFVAAGQTTATQAMNALRANSDVASRFEVSLDVTDGTSAALIGSRPIDIDARGITSGGSGIEWDQTSGLQIRNGDQTRVVDLQTAETVQDLLNLLNGSGASVLAQINEKGNGISVRSTLSGSDFTIGENGGSTATDLGLRSLTAGTELQNLNFGLGVQSVDGTDFIIRRNDGVELEIDTSSATTMEDVLNLINNHPNNLDPATAIVARLKPYGNGIELIDDNPTGTETLQVRRSGISMAAWDLGLVPRGEQTSAPPDPPAQTATASVAFEPPHQTNTALRVTAPNAGTEWNDVEVVFQSTLVGDVAIATYDAGTRRLTIDMADGATTTNTVIAAIQLEGTFAAELDTTVDPTNDGTGTLVAPAGAAATTSGGTAESLLGSDANPIETRGVFNALIRLQRAVEDFDVTEIERTLAMLDVNFDTLTFGRAEVGARGQALDAIAVRNDDEQVELKSVLSDEIDVDMAQAASDFIARQAAYEASLRSIASLHSLSLLDFI